MAKPEWGTKRICQSCGAKFYDMRRSPIHCPSCGAAFDPESVLRSRRAKPAPVKEKPLSREKIVEEVEVEVEEGEVLEEEGDDLLEDASDLGGEDDLEVEVEEDEDKSA